MNTAAWVSIYISGIVPGYLLGKKYQMADEDRWTVGMRKFAFFQALWSWAGCIVSLFCIMMLSDGHNEDKKASW